MRESGREQISLRLKKEVTEQLVGDIENPKAKQQKGLVYLADCDDVGAFYFERLNILAAMKKDGIIFGFKEVVKEDELTQWSDLEIEQDPEGWFEYKENFYPEERNFAEVIFNPKKVLELAGEETKPERREPIVAIKKAALNEQEKILLINGGVIVIPFKTKKIGLSINYADDADLSQQDIEELEREDEKTKQFKILCELWSHRFERRRGKLISPKGINGEFTHIEALIQYSKSKNRAATRKHILRLNRLFIKKGVPIEIEVINQEARLIVDMS